MIPVDEQATVLAGNEGQQPARLYFTPCVTLIFAHDPRQELSVDVTPEAFERRRGISPVIVQPTRKEWVEQFGDISQVGVGAAAQIKHEPPAASTSMPQCSPWEETQQTLCFVWNLSQG
jgi:hypothetical protein